MVALHRDDDDRITAHGSRRITPHMPRPPFEESPGRPATSPHLHLIPPGALPRVRIDALPDHTDYRDTGCEVSPRCQICPLDRCKYDEPVSARRAGIQRRDREIALLRRKHHAPIMALASTYGISRRTVFRILREQGGGRRQRHAAQPRHVAQPPLDGSPGRPAVNSM